jgi:hypothetical protein
VFTKNDLCDTENDGKTSSDNQWFIGSLASQGSKDPSEQPDDQSCRGEDYQPIERSSTDVEIIENDPALCIGWISGGDSACRSTRTTV